MSLHRQRKLILVVDDEPRWRELLINNLRASNLESCRVIGVENGRHALQLIQELKPECVLLDYLLPDMHGAELLRAAAKTVQENCVAVVMMSAQEDPSAAATCMQLGASRYIDKQALADTSIADVLEAAIAEAERKHSKQSDTKEANHAAGILNAHVIPVLAVDANSREVVYQNQAAKLLKLDDSLFELLEIPRDLIRFYEHIASLRNGHIKYGEVISWRGDCYQPMQNLYVAEQQRRLIISLIKAN